MSVLSVLGKLIRDSWQLMLVWGVLFAVAAQALQLLLLVIRFGDLPNYIINYDWVNSLVVIVQSTPSVKDMLPIIFEEWWVEIGFMNYEYGNGISEWSLNVIPSRLVILTVMGSMLVMLVSLQRASRCHAESRGTTRAASIAGASLGTILMCMTSAAMSWVVCCATPSWVVGLAMLGLGVSTSLALENLGPALFYSGFALLSLSILLLACQQVHQSQRHTPAGKEENSSMQRRNFALPLTRI